jgi:hypothetical protein
MGSDLCKVSTVIAELMRERLRYSYGAIARTRIKYVARTALWE